MRNNYYTQVMPACNMFVYTCTLDMVFRTLHTFILTQVILRLLYTL